MDIGEIAGDISGAVGGDPKKLLGSMGGLIGNSAGLQNLVGTSSKSGLASQVGFLGGHREEPGRRPAAALRRSAIGEDKVKAVAQEAGVSEGQAKTGLAAALPEARWIELTPNGSRADAGAWARSSAASRGMLGKVKS